VVAVAADPVEAAIWVDALHAAGIAADSIERSHGPAMGGATTPGWAQYHVLVPGSTLGEARSVIASLSGSSRLAPYQDPQEARDRQIRALVIVATTAVAIAAVAIAVRIAGG
jgi:hypothetical protein